ncbi:transglutaminase domain-containing protein [Paenibacillus radicibacter]|uniref:transglutaminase domain-containing protein n=1 Tax=Paenibacillus radicibacter TaxID=2972488 RepID=UPI00215938C0|nr:transglutaminase domain-containing protein [Paenibacillus radicibacter]
MITQSSAFSLDEQMMEEIEKKFQEKRQLAATRSSQLFDVFEEQLTNEEEWALKYLYAYMPVTDLADYEGALYLNHVRKTLEIRKQMPWGTTVPDYLFLHFVMPYRVNTENIEDSRGFLNEQLVERTSHLSMKDAILETNYWCHETATYIGSDLRTISPMTMIRNARGRCGEESTLAVAALRSIGIPARQVYTPRWAHSDSNHAWVEAWADGKWYYFGACEPEACLNQGWFTPPGRRAMLVNTRIFADYRGPEDITLADKWFTEINLLENYAPSRTIVVQVKDEQGSPIQGAEVNFQVYNTADFYPIAALVTDENGETSFKTGFGDLMLRAVYQGKWGQVKIHVGDAERFEVTIDQLEQPTGHIDFDMVPPPEIDGTDEETATEEAVQIHNQRLENGGKVRADYEATFLQEADAQQLAETLNLPADRVWDVLQKARGNSQEIAAFLRENTAEYGQWTLRLLESLREKDLIDTFRPTLNDHLSASMKLKGDYSDDVFASYILCPRVLFEMLAPYKQYFQEAFTEEAAASYRANPTELVAFIEEKWGIWQDLINLKGKGQAVGTYELQYGDRSSVDIMFVSICRSLGIPARVHPSEHKPQYLENGVWVDAKFVKGIVVAGHKANGTLRLLQDAEAASDAPVASYFENFSFARLENGLYKTLVYPYAKRDVYEESFEVEVGAYRLTTAVRLTDGTVQVRFTYFVVKADEETQVALTFRQTTITAPVLGTMDVNHTFSQLDGTTASLRELAGETGAVVAWIEPEREPSKHLIREMSELSEPLAQMGARSIFVIGDEEWSSSFDAARYPKLPPNAIFVRDSSYAALTKFVAQPSSGVGYPHLFVVDGQDQVRYLNSGYKLGAGREALQALTAIAKEAQGSEA